MIRFAAQVRSVQTGWDHLAGFHGETPVPSATVVLTLRADIQATEELRRLAGDGQVLHVRFEAVGRQAEPPPDASYLFEEAERSEA